MHDSLYSILCFKFYIFQYIVFNNFYFVHFMQYFAFCIPICIPKSMPIVCQQALPSIEFYLNETRTQCTGNPYISCVFCYSKIFQLLSIFKNLTTVDNKSPILTHQNTHFFHLKSSKLAQNRTSSVVRKKFNKII